MSQHSPRSRSESSSSSSTHASSSATKTGGSSHDHNDTPSIGLLEVYIASARDLRPPTLVAHLSKLNPYIKVTLGSQSHSTATPAATSTTWSSCPAWDEYATFMVSESARLLRVECWDRGRVVADSLLGYGVIELDAVLKAEKCVTGWFGLKHSGNGKEVAKVQLHLAFYPKEVSKQGRVHAPGLAMSPLCLASGSSSAANNSRSTICVSSLASASTQLVHTLDDVGESRKPTSSIRPLSMAALYQSGRDRHASSISDLNATSGVSLAPSASEAGDQRPFRPRQRSSICFDLNVEPDQHSLDVPVKSPTGQEMAARAPARPYPLAPFAPTTYSPAIPAFPASPACAEQPPEFFHLDELALEDSQPNLEPDLKHEPETPAIATAESFPTTLRLADLAAPSSPPAPPLPRIPPAFSQRPFG
ncbi:C2 domain-containing protein [Catenaria anguillulae PL171]|uniref:C2 domain-containing protein n=1 Tax=Catenaria anguillulae PL171 TaxID=765915 RepID=A0A1Y2HZ81_9FUNG|nr:C2 domain-containing protein [Catenaria anguillulae PL171]